MVLRKPALMAVLGTLLGLAHLGAATLVVANKSEATLSLVDLDSGRVVATLPTGQGPHEVAVSPDGRWAVVSNYGSREEAGNSLTVIEVPAARGVRTIDLGEYRRPHGMAWLSDNRHLLVTAEDRQALLKVDARAGEIVDVIETGQRVSHMVVVTPDDRLAFIANIGSGTVTVVDVEESRHLRDIATGDGAEGIDVTPDGKEIWVTNRSADTVSVVGVDSLEVLATVESASFPIRAKVSPDGEHILVTNARSGDVSVLDRQKRSVARRIELQVEARDTEGRLMGGFGDSSVPIGVLIEPGGKRAYVAHANADTISVIDLERFAPVGSLTAGREPDGMGYSHLSVSERSAN
jgi:YVTN family beta-propeller protein